MKDLRSLSYLNLNTNKISRLKNIQDLKHIWSINLDNNPIPEKELDKLGGKRTRKTILQNY